MKLVVAMKTTKILEKTNFIIVLDFQFTKKLIFCEFVASK
jgi:hypothetical protein